MLPIQTPTGWQVPRYPTPVEISVDPDSGMWLVKAEYRKLFAQALKAVPGRKWLKDTKLTAIPREQGSALWALIQTHFAGQFVRGTRGVFLVLPTA